MFNLRELDLAKLPKVARPLYADNLQRYGHQLLESLRELVLGKEYDKAASCVSLLLTQFHAYSAACLRVSTEILSSAPLDAQLDDYAIRIYRKILSTRYARPETFLFAIQGLTLYYWKKELYKEAFDAWIRHIHKLIRVVDPERIYFFLALCGFAIWDYWDDDADQIDDSAKQKPEEDDEDDGFNSDLFQSDNEEAKPPSPVPTAKDAAEDIISAFKEQIKEDNSESEDDEQNLEKKKEADTETKDQVTDAGEDDDDDIWNFGDEDDAKKRTEAEDPAEKRQKLSVSGLKERHKRQPVGYQLERRFMEMEEGLYFSFAKFTTISLEQQEAVRFIIATKAQYTRNETSDSYFELARTYFIKTIQMYNHQGLIEEAKITCTEFCDHNPLNPLGFRALSVLLQEHFAEDYNFRIQVLAKLLELDPCCEDSIKQILSLYQLKKDNEELKDVLLLCVQNFCLYYKHIRPYLNFSQDEVLLLNEMEQLNKNLKNYQF